MVSRLRLLSYCGSESTVKTVTISVIKRTLWSLAPLSFGAIHLEGFILDKCRVFLAPLAVAINVARAGLHIYLDRRTNEAEGKTNDATACCLLWRALCERKSATFRSATARQPAEVSLDKRGREPLISHELGGLFFTRQRCDGRCSTSRHPRAGGRLRRYGPEPRRRLPRHLRPRDAFRTAHSGELDLGEALCDAFSNVLCEQQDADNTPQQIGTLEAIKVKILILVCPDRTALVVQAHLYSLLTSLAC